MASTYEIQRALPFDPTTKAIAISTRERFLPPLIHYFYNKDGETTLASPAVEFAITIVVTDDEGMIVGDNIVISSAIENRVYTGQIVAIATNTITLDTPLDSVFPAGSNVSFGSRNLAVDGSETTKVFSLRAGEPTLAIDAHLTKVTFRLLATEAVSLDKFGDQAALINGIVLRVVNGQTFNIFNAKTNGDLANIMPGFQIFSEDNPVQGQNAFTSNMGFTGPDNLGTSVLVSTDSDIELLVQDDLTDLLEFTLIAEGHLVQA